MRFIPKKINLDQQGLSKVLGSLEAEIMEILWRDGDASVRAVCDSLSGTKAYSFNTIMTVMNRLVEKELLAKSSGQNGFLYAPRMSRATFIASVNRSVFATLLRDDAVFPMSAFMDALGDASDDDLRKLRHMIDERGV